MRRFHADLLLGLAAAIWGFAFLFQKSAMSHVGPLQFVAARAAVAALALAPFAALEMRAATATAAGMPTRWRDVARAAIPAGFAFYFAAILQQAGLVTAGVTNTGFLTALYVVVTPFMAWTLDGRRPSPVIWLAVALSVAGTWLLGGGGGLAGFSRGDGLVALSAVLWGLHVVLTSRAGTLGRPLAFTFAQFVVVGALGAVVAPAIEPVSWPGLVGAWREIAYVGLFSSALTFTLFSLALRYVSASEASIIVSTETLFAAFGAWTLLGERLAPLGWLGAALILAATFAVQLAPPRVAPAGPG